MCSVPNYLPQTAVSLSFLKSISFSLFIFSPKMRVLLLAELLGCNLLFLEAYSFIKTRRNGNGNNIFYGKNPY